MALFRSTFRSLRGALTSRNSRYASALVLGQHEDGVLSPSCVSAITAAAQAIKGGNISLLLAGCGASLDAASKDGVSAHPAVSQVLLADSAKLEHQLAEPLADLLVWAQRKGSYSHIVTASDSFGKNILPRAAALLDVSPVSDVTQIIDEQTFIRPIYAGNALSTVRYKGPGPCMFSVRPTSFPSASKLSMTGLGSASVIRLDMSEYDSEGCGRSKWVNLSSQNQSERPELGSARVVISGGRGLKSAEGFRLLEALADRLGGAVGASRAAVDAGFVPNDMQIGQTGKVVAPELYIAVGISGAIQHIAGIKDSKVIVAINKDKEAPIFQVADYGLAADLFEVLPELISKVPKVK